VDDLTPTPQDSLVGIMYGISHSPPKIYGPIVLALLHVGRGGREKTYIMRIQKAAGMEDKGYGMHHPDDLKRDARTRDVIAITPSIDE